MYSLVLHLVSGYLCTHILDPLINETPHFIRQRRKQHSHPGILPLVIPPPHGSTSVTCLTMHNKAYETTAIAGKHTTPYHRGEKSHVRIAPANVVPTDRSASVTCLTTHSKGNIIAPPKLAFGLHAPICCIHFPRETQTDIYSPR